MSEEKKFLIRSAGEILGPFSKQEVIDLIKRSQISIFDEVAEPFSIWWYLQDHQDFKKIVYSMDVQTRLTNFITQISGKITNISQTKKTEGEGLTQTNTETLDQTKSQTGDGVKAVGLDVEKKQSADEASFEVLDQPKSSPPSSAKYRSRLESEEAVRIKVSWLVRISWYLVLLFSLSVGVYVIYKEAIVPAQKKQKVRERIQSRGLKFYKAGDHRQALPYFEEADLKNILQEEEKLLLASLFIQEGKIQRASGIVKQLSNDSPSKSTDWFLLQGLLSFFQNNFPEAEKNFNFAKKQKPQLSLLNLALLKWKTGDYKTSVSYLDQLLKIGYERDIVFYLKALNLLFQNQITELVSYIDQEIHLDESSGFIEYKQELYLILAYVHGREGKTEELEKLIQLLLNEDPFFGKEYQYNSFLAVKALNWNVLYPYCQSIFESDPKNNLFNALYGFCHLKVGNLKQGSRYIEQAKNRAPEAPLFLSLYAYLLMLQDRDIQLEQVLALIDYDKLKREDVLPFILRARFFEGKEDWVRALTVWKKLLSFHENHLSALGGVAVANYKLGDTVAGAIYRGRGLREYPHYVRLLPYPDFAF